MKKTLNLTIDRDISLVVAGTEATEDFHNLIEKNQEHLHQWKSWLEQVQGKRQVHYFLEKNQRFYNELISGDISASNHPGFQFLIVFKKQTAGLVGFQGISLKNDICALGYWIGTEFEGQGLVTKSAQKVIEYGFEVLGINRVEIQCAVDNLRSIKVAERLGFVQEGRLAQVEKRGNEYVDHFLFRMLKQSKT